MNPKTRQRYKPLIWTAAILFFFLGIAGLFLPFLQGILFLLVSLYLMSTVSPRIRLMKIKARRRHPKAAEWQDKAEDWVRTHIFKRQRQT